MHILPIKNTDTLTYRSITRKPISTITQTNAIANVEKSKIAKFSILGFILSIFLSIEQKVAKQQQKQDKFKENTYKKYIEKNLSLSNASYEEICIINDFIKDKPELVKKLYLTKNKHQNLPIISLSVDVIKNPLKSNYLVDKYLFSFNHEKFDKIFDDLQKYPEILEEMCLQKHRINKNLIDYMIRPSAKNFDIEKSYHVFGYSSDIDVHNKIYEEINKVMEFLLKRLVDGTTSKKEEIYNITQMYLDECVNYYININRDNALKCLDVLKNQTEHIKNIINKKLFEEYALKRWETQKLLIKLISLSGYDKDLIKDIYNQIKKANCQYYDKSFLQNFIFNLNKQKDMDNSIDINPKKMDVLKYFSVPPNYSITLLSSYLHENIINKGKPKTDGIPSFDEILNNIEAEAPEMLPKLVETFNEIGTDITTSFKPYIEKCIKQIYESIKKHSSNSVIANYENVQDYLYDKNVDFNNIDNLLAAFDFPFFTDKKGRDIPGEFLLKLADIIPNENNIEKYQELINKLESLSNINYDIKDRNGISFLEKALISENKMLLKLLSGKQLTYYPELDYVYNQIQDKEVKRMIGDLRLAFYDFLDAMKVSSSSLLLRHELEFSSPFYNKNSYNLLNRIAYESNYKLDSNFKHIFDLRSKDAMNRNEALLKQL